MDRQKQLVHAKVSMRTLGRLAARELAEKLLNDLRLIARTWDLDENDDTLIELFEAWSDSFDAKFTELVYGALCLPRAAQVLSQPSENEPLSPEAYAERLGEGP